MRNVQKRHETVGEQFFEGSNVVSALREILSDILNEDSLPTTYLLVDALADALDECTAGLSDLLQIVTDHSVGRRSRIKWLVPGCSMPNIKLYLNLESLDVKINLELSTIHVSKAVSAFVEF
jgi:hypothetical protein